MWASLLADLDNKFRRFGDSNDKFVTNLCTGQAALQNQGRQPLPIFLSLICRLADTKCIARNEWDILSPHTHSHSRTINFPSLTVVVESYCRSMYACFIKQLVGNAMLCVPNPKPGLGVCNKSLPTSSRPVLTSNDSRNYCPTPNRSAGIVHYSDHLKYFIFDRSEMWHT